MKDLPYYITWKHLAMELKAIVLLKQKPQQTRRTPNGRFKLNITLGKAERRKLLDVLRGGEGSSEARRTAHNQSNALLQRSETD